MDNQPRINYRSFSNLFFLYGFWILDLDLDLHYFVPLCHNCPTELKVSQRGERVVGEEAKRWRDEEGAKSVHRWCHYDYWKQVKGNAATAVIIASLATNRSNNNNNTKSNWHQHSLTRDRERHTFTATYHYSWHGIPSLPEVGIDMRRGDGR